MGCQSEKRQRRPPEKQQEVTGSSKNLPFLGKSFYLDLPNNKHVEFLVVTIKQLGGVIESFLSKEISYVVSSSKEAKLDSGPRRQTEKQSSAASGDAKAKTLPKGSHAGPHHKPADSALISRGKELLQKAMRNQDSSSGSKMMAYVQQLLFRVSGARRQSEKMMVKCFSVGPGVLKVGKLKPPFLKIEDRSRKFRPFYHQFKSFPDLNFLAPNRSSPFEPLKTPSSSCRVRAPEGCLTHSERERSPRSSPAAAPKRRKGFCECCQETFGELQMHLQSPRHRRFALDASRYAAVDQVIAQLTNDFAEIPAWSSPPRVPCSPVADEELCGSQAKAVEGLGTPAAELGQKHQLARKDQAELRLSAVAMLGRECSRGPEEMPKEKVSQLPPAQELPAGHPLLGLRAEMLRARPSASPGPAGRAHAWCRNTDRSAVGSSPHCTVVLATAPDLSRWPQASDGLTGEAAACSPELVPQDALEPLSHPLGASPRPRKRKLSASPRPRLGKKPRIRLSSDALQLEKQMGTEHCSSVHRGAEGAAGTAPSGAPGAELLLLSSRLCSFPASGRPQDSTRVLPEPVPMAIDDTEATLASTATQQSWERGTPEGQPPEKAPEPPCCVAGSGLELQSPTWDKASCSAVQPALPRLPIPQARHLCCTEVAEGAPPTSIDLGESILQPAPNLGPSPSSSESDWDGQLLCSLDTLQGTRNRPVDLEVLRRTCISVRDSGYESHLYSVLKQKSELDWACRDDQSCRNCRVETEGAPFAVFEACLGSWTS
ncbi:protein DBF4 homolog B isoform X4 [Malaclemys terrapin pileata]|uniref:protein DBF4 homolog B isoform X4 n=1 Tax=Malaclemys terrapin pileata TaxID=2991368 RepID=UPI0023A86E1B|nr:protein DBF4 homolog B isoform X4 [Malaclemys terrapin pileata]